MSDKFDDSILDRIDRLHAEATPGKWVGGGHKECGYGWVKIPGYNTTGTNRQAGLGQYLGADDDALYMAEACNVAPELVARIRELNSLVAAKEAELADQREVISTLKEKNGHLDHMVMTFAERLAEGNQGRIMNEISWADREAHKRTAKTALEHS